MTTPNRWTTPHTVETPHRMRACDGLPGAEVSREPTVEDYQFALASLSSEARVDALRPFVGELRLRGVTVDASWRTLDDLGELLRKAVERCDAQSARVADLLSELDATREARDVAYLARNEAEARADSYRNALHAAEKRAEQAAELRASIAESRRLLWKAWQERDNADALTDRLEGRVTELEDEIERLNLGRENAEWNKSERVRQLDTIARQNCDLATEKLRVARAEQERDEARANLAAACDRTHAAEKRADRYAALLREALVPLAVIRSWGDWFDRVREALK